MGRLATAEMQAKLDRIRLQYQLPVALIAHMHGFLGIAIESNSRPERPLCFNVGVRAEGRQDRNFASGRFPLRDLLSAPCIRSS